MRYICKKHVPKSPLGLSVGWPERLRGPCPCKLQQQNCSGRSNYTLAHKPRIQSFLIFCHFFIKEKVKYIINILIINFVKIDVISLEIRRQAGEATEKPHNNFLYVYQTQKFQLLK